MSLKISDNRRYLVNESGDPFFYLGDTAWELFHRLNREEAELYLTTRQRQGFTVIQAVVLAEHEFGRPNAYGDLPLVDNDPTRPVEDYFEHVDWVVSRAADLGMYIGMLPTWGDKWNRKWGQGPEIFDEANAFAFGEYVGKRYLNAPIIWILGGDRPVETDNHRAIIQAMANGLNAGDGGVHLKTFHPMGQETSSKYFHDAGWLDFNMYQTGHNRNGACYRMIAGDYALNPIKPCMDAEPGYEDHPNGFKPENGYLDDADVRKFAYWDLFAGAFGHTYGCHDVWQFLDERRFKPVTSPRTPWREAILLPGAEQMRHVAALMRSRPFLSRIPDQSLIASGEDIGADHVSATRATDGSYAFLYVPTGKTVSVCLSQLSGHSIAASWYDPRTGESIGIGSLAREGVFTFQAPQEEFDWVLILDDEAFGFPPPS